MKRIVVVVALFALLLAGGALLGESNLLAPATSQASGTSAGMVGVASAQEAIRTVELKVDNLWCASCNYIVRQVLTRTPGVLDAKFIARTDIVVTYDPNKADVASLIAATTNYGYPSRVVVQ